MTAERSLTVGRETELTALTGLVDNLSDSRGGAIALVGEAGIGKSHLLRSATSHAEGRGVNVVSGRATDVGNTEAYRPLLEVTSRVLDEDPDTPYGDLVRGMLGVGGLQTQPITPTALGEALLHLCSGRLVVLEDLHWADPDSIAAIEYVIDHASDADLAVLLTMRTDEGDQIAMIRRAAARRSVRMLEVDALNERQTRKLASAVGGASAANAARAIHRWSGGVPLIIAAVASDPGAVEALVNGWPTAPATFADVIAKQLARLDDGDRRVLATAALLGDDIDPTAVALVAGVDGADVISCLRRAVGSNLVEPDGSRFHHSLTRVVILDQLLAFERRELAERALASLPDAEPVTRARLATEVGDTEEAARLLLDAGKSAARVGALANAEDLLRQSLSLKESHEARAELVDALAAAGKASEVIGATQNLSAAAEAQRTRMSLARAHALRLAGRTEDAERLLAKLSYADSEEAVAVTLLASTIRLDADDFDAALSILTPMLADESVSDLRRSEALCLAGRAHREQLRWPDARDAFEAAIGTAEGSLRHLATARFELGTLDFVEFGSYELLEQASRDAVAAGALELAAHADHLKLVHRLERLEPLDDMSGFEDFLARVGRLGLGPLQRTLVGSFTLAHALGLDLVGAERWLAECERDGVRDQWTALAHTSMAMFQMMSENRVEALDLFVAAEESYEPDWIRFPWRRLGKFCALLEGRDYVGIPGWRPLDEAIELSVTALEHGMEGRDTAAAEAAERSFEMLEPVPRFRAFLQRLVSEGAIRDGFGEPQRWLDEAIPVLADSPYDAVTAAARRLRSCSSDTEESEADGSETMPSELSDRGVTPREFEVLELLVEGHSYAEIGEKIHMSPRTVEGHVGRIRNKFDGIGRVELIVAVAEALGRR